MGNWTSTQEPPETQSIVGHGQHDYHTQGDGGRGQHIPKEEAKILSNNLNRYVLQEDVNVLGVFNSEGKAGPDRRDLRIAYDRKDTSSPLAVTLDSITRQDNWPPLPTFCPVGPCFYQDINVDIPLEFQKIVRMLYYLWMFHVLMLMLNILGGLSMFIALSDGATFGLAIVYFFIFTPFSYVCWFRPVYKAFRSDSSFNFMVFFFVFFCQLVVSIINAIGIPSTGSCGIILGLTSLAGTGVGPKVAGGIILLIAAGWVALALTDFITILQVHRIYRSTGASFAKAQAEFSQGVMRNEHVQSATANAASAVIRNQMNQATTPGTNSTSPRF